MTSLPALGPRGEGWVVLQGALLAVVAIAGLAGPALTGPPRVVAAIAGLSLIVLGGALAVRGLIDLRDALTPMPRPRDGAQLVDTGAYRLARHPVYGGIVIVAVGYALVMAAPAALASAALLLAFFRLKSAREEAWLEERYPGYPAYRVRTRRLIPGLY